MLLVEIHRQRLNPCSSIYNRHHHPCDCTTSNHNSYKTKILGILSSSCHGCINRCSSTTTTTTVGVHPLTTVLAKISHDDDDKVTTQQPRRQQRDTLLDWIHIVVDRIDTIVSIIPLPVVTAVQPGLPIIPFNVKLGYVLVLLMEGLIVGPIAAFLSTLLFTVLRYIGQRLVVVGLEDWPDDDPDGTTLTTVKDDETEQELISQIDGVTIVLSVLTAILVLPNDSRLEPSINMVFVIGVLALITTLVFTSIQNIEQEEQLSENDKALMRWDANYRKQTKKKSADE